MAITSTFRVEAQVKAGKTPKVYNVSAAVANSEVFQALSSDTTQFMIKVRDNAKLQLAYVATESATNYLTIRPGAVLSVDSIDFSGTLYFQTDKSGQTVEIVEWT